jgi:GAG-pre-integrase domain
LTRFISTSDVTNSISNFTEVPPGSWSVKGIGNSNYPVQGYGDVNIWATINGQQKASVLKNVLYVPNIGTNLFSIAAATDLGLRVIFEDLQVLLSIREGEVVMEGNRVGRKLYLLAISPRDSGDDPIKDTAYSSSMSPGLNTWHRRLAHASYKTIIKMNSLGAVEEMDLVNTEIPPQLCAGCVRS